MRPYKYRVKHSIASIVIESHNSIVFNKMALRKSRENGAACHMCQHKIRNNITSSVDDDYDYITKGKNGNIYQGRIQDFKLGGTLLKKLRRAEGGAKIFGAFRVRKITILRQKINFFSNFRGGDPPPGSAPVYDTFVETDLELLPLF